MQRRIIDHRTLLECGHSVDHMTDHGNGDAPIRGDVEQNMVDCDACDRRELPASVVPGRRTRRFTATTVPAGLLADHLTNAWARLVVEEGWVTFVETETSLTMVAGPHEGVTIVPGRRHHIEPSEDAHFAVQFYDLDPPTT